MFPKKIILASASPRRADLLSLAEVEFEVRVSNTDELILPEWTIEETACLLAKQKAAVVHNLQDDSITLAADTIVVLGNEVLGKPTDLQHAKTILRQLSGNMHKVITGVAICRGNKIEVFSETTEVYFRELTDNQIDFYVDNFQPLDKAGAYAIQEYIGAVGIHKIIGDYYNVMGLPISSVLDCLNTKFKD